MSLTRFLADHCARDVSARIKFIDFQGAFRAELPEAEREAWTRTRLTAELGRAGFCFGADKTGTMWVVGITLKDSAPWTVANGRLVRG
jgi:hypothetical protein